MMPSRVAWEIRRFDTIDSTNRYLLDEARAGAAQGLVAVADHQSAGRGRRGRTWDAPSGASLLCSVLLRPQLPPDRLQVAAMAAGVAMTEAIDRIAGFRPALKWPNDLVVGDRKLAGLLAESDGDAVVIGIGVNVEWHEFPRELAATATACNVEAGRPVDRSALLARYLDALEQRYAALDGVVAEYRARLATIGRRVRVERSDGELVGRAVGVGAAGELLVALDGASPDAPPVAVHVGDVIHLRDAPSS